MKKISYLVHYINFLYRYITARKRSLPDFIIIGEAKCGTTSLFNYLTENKLFIPPIKKEIHYFDYKYSKGITWYKAHFPVIKNKKFKTGEATPYYYFHPRTLYRMLSQIPDLKIILMVRNPSERAISSFHNNIRRNLEPLGQFSKAIIRENKLRNKAIEKIELTDFVYEHKYQMYMERGLYYNSYQKLVGLVDKRNILVLEFDEFFGDLKNQYPKVLDFLELDRSQVIANKIHNNVNYNEENKKVKDYLNEFYYQSNLNFFKLIEREFNWNEKES